MADRGEVLLQATVTNAKESARGLRAGARRVNTSIDEEFEGRLQVEAVLAMQAVAPEDTGLLKEIIEAEVNRGRGRTTLRVTSEVQDPASGFHYTAVTRFGHRKKFLRASHEGKPAGWSDKDPTSGRRTFNQGRGPTMAVHTKGRYGQPIYRAVVRGYRPASDWVEAGMPAVDEAASRAADNIGRKVVTAVRTR